MNFAGIHDLRLSRRVLFAGIGIAGLVVALPTDATDNDRVLIDSIIASKQDLVGTYTATALAIPSSATKLRAIASHHARHITSLDAIAGITETPSPSATASAVTTLAALSKIEMTNAALRRTQVQSAANPELIRVLALIGASEAVHGTQLATA